MGKLDDLMDTSKNIMNDPAKKAKIEKIAKDKGISMEEAKTHFLKQNKS